VPRVAVPTPDDDRGVANGGAKVGHDALTKLAAIAESTSGTGCRSADGRGGDDLARSDCDGQGRAEGSVAAAIGGHIRGAEVGAAFAVAGGIDAGAGKESEGEAGIGCAVQGAAHHGVIAAGNRDGIGVLSECPMYRGYPGQRPNKRAMVHPAQRQSGWAATPGVAAIFTRYRRLQIPIRR
jgi:hypothetical protein